MSSPGVLLFLDACLENRPEVGAFFPLASCQIVMFILQGGPKAHGDCKKSHPAFIAEGALNEYVQRHPAMAFQSLPVPHAQRNRPSSWLLTFRPHLHIQQLDLSVEMASLNLEVFSRPRNIPMVLPKFAADVFLFEGISSIPEGVIGF